MRALYKKGKKGVKGRWEDAMGNGKVNAYFKPTHPREPFPKATNALSIRWASTGSSQRVGSKRRALGK